MKEKSQEKWWSDGLKFECQQSGKCCVSHGEYGFVYVTREDRRNMAQTLKMSTIQFTKKFCDKSDGIYHIKDTGSECLFLLNNKCTVYKSRPTQCRTWPWWPETMNAKAWKKEVVTFCPGVGKGRKWSAEEIDKNIAEQAEWEENLHK
ncbi:MAG: YkgJ family cysteine cluster protein [Bdellovibrionales bacterium]|nr:YkgJ family cysteine cluster protein [Bdellovibrionales bacterium]